MSMRKESGEITSDREEILKYAQISTNHSVTKQCPHRKVHSNQVQTQKNTRVYRRRIRKGHTVDEKTHSPWNGWIYK